MTSQGSSQWHSREHASSQPGGHCITTPNPWEPANAACDAEGVDPTPLGPVFCAVRPRVRLRGGLGQSHQVLDLPSTAVSKKKEADGPDVS